MDAATADSTAPEPVGNGFDNDRRQSVGVDETEAPLPPAPAVQPPAVDEATQKLVDNVLFSEVRGGPSGLASRIFCAPG
jgi:hypothetical protein